MRLGGTGSEIEMRNALPLVHVLHQLAGSRLEFQTVEAVYF